MTPVLAATTLIGIFTIASKLLGLARDMVLANRFGAGAIVDIYVAAFRIPDLIFNLLVLGTLSAAFIPVFVEYLGRDKKEAFAIASTLFSLTMLVMGLLAVIGFIFAESLTRLVVPGFSLEAQADTASLTRVMMLSPLLFSLSSVLTSILHSYKKFLVAAIAPLFYNLSIIFGILFLYPVFGLKGLAFGVVTGAGLHFLIQFPSSLSLGLRPFSRFALHHPGVKKIGRLFLPRIFGIDLGQISLFISSAIGSFLVPGSIAVFYIAFNLEAVPLGVFAIPFAITSFPVLAEYFSKRDFRSFKDYFSKTVVQVLFLIIPISVLMLLLRAQITRLIPGALEGTSFTFEDTRLTARSLGFFTLSLFAQSLVPILARSFYALQNTIIPVMVGLLAAAINLVLAYVLAMVLGPAGMALAFSVAAVINMMVLFAALRRKLGGDLNDEYLVLRTVKISIASVVMGIAVFITLYAVAPLVNMQTYLGVLVQTIAACLVAGITYLAAGLFIKLPETSKVMIILKKWASKLPFAN